MSDTSATPAPRRAPRRGASGPCPDRRSLSAGSSRSQLVLAAPVHPAPAIVVPGPPEMGWGVVRPSHPHSAVPGGNCGV